MRLHIPYAKQEEKIVLRIHFDYTARMQVKVHRSQLLLQIDAMQCKRANFLLQVFVGGQYMEDINTYNGISKAQLVISGRWTPNAPGGAYIDQQLSLSCSCDVGGSCRSSDSCSSPSNVHGANARNRAEGMLEVVIGGHVLEEFVEIRAMPVVAVTFSLSLSFENFYRAKV